MANRLRVKYEKEVVPELKKILGAKNKMALPRISKVIVNMGVGDALKNKELMEQHKKDLMAITGQFPSERAARVSVSSFSLRKGMKVGLKVTLRGERMYAFLDRLFSIVLPRFRDFRGLSVKKFDSQGNYTLGINEHTVFPEVDVAKSAPHGLEMTIVVTGKNKDNSQKMLKLMGMPFEKEE